MHPLKKEKKRNTKHMRIEKYIKKGKRFKNNLLQPPESSTCNYRRTADVRSVGYSELLSLSREDVLAAMKDYPEAQEILQNLGRKRLMEAQRVARVSRQQTSPGHDSSDNSTGKSIVNKLKSDVKGLKNALRKGRRNTKPDQSLELQPLTPKSSTLKRQQKVDDNQDASASNVQEPPVSPLGAGLPLLARLRLLKEKEEREDGRHLVETQIPMPEPPPPPTEALNPMNPNLPFLQRILLLKADKEAPTKEPLLPKNTIPEESQEPSPTPPPKFPQKQPSIQSAVIQTIKSPTTSMAIESTNGSIVKKPWAMLKDASLTNKESSPQETPPVNRLQLKQNLTHIRQQTKMYASVDDLSPEYCGLPFVKKLKILNERQKLAELERAVRSSSLDCGENSEIEFDGSLMRSHSEACAIEYAMKLEKFNKVCRSKFF